MELFPNLILDMATKTDKSLKDRLQEEMKRRGVKVPQLEKETGIPKDRVYKWFQTENVPKYEDAIILEKWIKGNDLPDTGIKKPETVQVLGDATKIDTILTLVLQLSTTTQQNSSDLQVLNQQMRGLEQMSIANAAIQEEYQRFLVRKLDAGNDADKTMEELQQTAFEKILGRQIKGKNQNSHSLHR